jgi:hypothetical protein
MNANRSIDRQRGVSAWTLAGTLFLVFGLAGLGVALIMPGSQTTNGKPISAVGAGKAVAAGAMPSPVAKAANTGSGPHLSWHGTWRGVGSDVKLVITPDGVGECKWINATEPRFAADCVSRQYETAVAMFQRDPSDFKISDPVQSRQMISKIKPGNYRKIWMHSGSDCGGAEMIVDGDLLLQIEDCKYGHRILLFARDSAATRSARRAPDAVANAIAAGPKSNGRWQGQVSQAGYPPYPAVLQLQSNAAGVPAGTMAYPTLGCTATLTFAQAESNVDWFTESIQQGRGKCQDGGLISITPAGSGAVSWKYFLPANVNMPVATATMQR